MGVFDKFKDLLGLDNGDYEDDYFDDYYDDEDDYYDDNTVEDNILDEDESKVKEYKTKESNSFNKFKRSNVINISDGYESERVKILIHEPITYDDSPNILDDIISKNVVVLNLEMLEIDVKRKTFDFVSGGIYAIEGKMQKVTKDIFVIAPKELEIDGKIKDQIQSKGFYQL